MTDYLKGPGLNAPNLNWRADHLPAGSHKFTSNPDINGKYILNPAGIGGAAGKAITIVGTAADIKTACEDAAIQEVWILPATYTFNAVIAPTSNKRILALGAVLLDWNGAANGYMFNTGTNTDIVFENIDFRRTGSIYYAIYTGAGSRYFLVRCRTSWGATIWYHGSHFRILGGKFVGNFLFLNASDIDFLGCEIQGSLTQHYNSRNVRLTGCYFTAAGQFVFANRSGYSSARETVFNACHWISSTADRCVHLYTDVAGAVTFQSIKFTNCVFQPLNNTKPCIHFLNSAGTITTQDVSFENCTFKTAAQAYYLPSGTHNNWKFIANRYDAITDIYAFAGSVQNNFVYVSDGDMT